jgi:hypothetical protein
MGDPSMKELLVDLEDSWISLSAIELETAYLQGIEDGREDSIITDIIRRTAQEATR